MQQKVSPVLAYSIFALSCIIFAEIFTFRLFPVSQFGIFFLKSAMLCAYLVLAILAGQSIPPGLITPAIILNVSFFYIFLAMIFYLGIRPMFSRKKQKRK